MTCCNVVTSVIRGESTDNHDNDEGDDRKGDFNDVSVVADYSRDLGVDKDDDEEDDDLDINDSDADKTDEYHF